MKQLIVVGLLILALAGCTTTRTLPDGTVEVEQLDPAVIQAFVALASAALEAHEATSDDTVPDQPDRDLMADILELQEIAQATRLIAADGVTAEELAQLQALYRRASEILARNGVRVKVQS